MTINGTTTAETDIYIIRADLNNTIKNVGGKKVTLKAFNSNFTLYGQVTGGRYIQATKDLTDAETEIVNSFIRIPANTVCNNLKVYPQIEVGEGTNYEEHQEQKIILDIQKEMLTGDYFVKENDGWKEVHNWDIVSFDGTENSWILTPGIAHRFRVNYNNTSLNDSNQYCTHSKTRSNWAVNNGEFSVRTPNEIYFNSSDFNTLEEFKAWLVQQNTNGTPLTFYFKCEQYKINCTEAQIKALEQLNKLRFYKNVNNIYTTEDIALLQAEYEVDLQKLKGIPGPKRRQRRYWCEGGYRSNWSKRG